MLVFICETKLAIFCQFLTAKFNSAFAVWTRNNQHVNCNQRQSAFV